MILVSMMKVFFKIGRFKKIVLKCMVNMRLFSFIFKIMIIEVVGSCEI